VVTVKNWPLVRIGPDQPTTLPVGGQPLRTVWDGLSAAAGRAPTSQPWAGVSVSTVELTVNGTTERCYVSGLAVRLGVFRDNVWPDPLRGKAQVSTADTPAGVRALAGCQEPGYRPTPAGGHVLLNTANVDLARWWITADQGLPDDLVMPPYVDPRTVDARAPIAAIPPTVADIEARFAKLLAGYKAPTEAINAARWWRFWTELMASPLTDPALRSAAFDAAALRDPGPDAIRPDVTADVTGRSGVTIRVPYEDNGSLMTADLTFADTGKLLQRVIRRTTTGVKFALAITLYDPA
jgi:hypothetical protein